MKLNAKKRVYRQTHVEKASWYKAVTSSTPYEMPTYVRCNSSYKDILQYSHLTGYNANESIFKITDEARKIFSECRISLPKK